MSTDAEDRVILATREQLGNRLDEFVSLVREGAAVSPKSLADRLPKMVRVAFVERNGRMIAAAAIKEASPSRAKTLTKLSGYQLSGDMRELGYVVVSCEWRGLGLSGKVIREILAVVDEEGLFATTSEPKMKCILAKIGFRWVGREWPSTERQGELLTLWVRNSSQVETKEMG